MSLRRRILRICLTILVVLLFAGYFAFSTLLFSPIEGDYEFDLATLVPRNVDFFVAKRELAQDFTEFPSLVLTERLRELEYGRLLVESPELQNLLVRLELEASLAELEASLADLPIELDLLSVFGGEEVLVAGYLRGADLGRADFVAVGRTNWLGKLGQSLLAYPGLIGIEDQGLSVDADGGVSSIQGGQLSRPLHVARIADVLVLGTDKALVASALELEAAKGQDSFGLSARYADYIQGQRNREPEDIEFFLDHDALMANLGMDGNVPDIGSQDFTPAFLARLGQLKLFKELEGVISFAGGLSLDLHADISSEKLTSAQKRFYRQSGFTRERSFEVARLAPSDAGVLAYLQADVADILRMVLESTEPALQDNFNDLVRSVWGYPEGATLIDEIDSGLKDRLALVMCPMDYPDEGVTGPPHDDKATMAWAVVGWVKDKQVLDSFRLKVINNQSRLAIQGRNSGESGVFTNEIAGGLIVYEYWSPMQPGTGHLASVVTDDIFIVGNHHRLLEDILLTYLGDPDHPSLEDQGVFSSLVQIGLDSSSGMLWLNPNAVGSDLRELAEQAARDAVTLDWTIERPRIERLVLKREYGGRSADDLNPDEYSSYERVLDDELSAFEAQFYGENVGALAERFDRYVRYLQMMRGGLLQISLDPKRIDLSMRTVVPLGSDIP